MCVNIYCAAILSSRGLDMTEWIISILLLIAMLGFVSTVAVCKYLLRGDIIE
ncbi:hypothetical protein EMK97_17480 [Litorilituus sediminis]|uniref:K+/H+ antiporter subunit F n=1 Tax=Litorilituus sediminis TaxID=718192 RepID=A0A4V0ZGI3_9GAMM|nr:hypothetical protein EMK97_17480 [Litorilituus sediminis]